MSDGVRQNHGCEQYKRKECLHRELILFTAIGMIRAVRLNLLH